MNRRRFLETASALSGGGLLGASCRGAEGVPPRGRGLAQPLTRVGVQLYTVRSLMSEDVAGTLSEVGRIGYDEVEFAGTFGHPPTRIRGWLEDAGLQAPAAHVDPSELALEAMDRTLEAASVIGFRWLIQAFIPAESRTADGYRSVADNLNRTGERASGEGVRVGYHNHAFEFEPLGDTTGYEILLDRLDPAYVDLEIDFHWTAVGGADPLALFEAHPGRFRLCHVKDLDRNGAMVDVGAGVIDWAHLFARSATAGLDHYFVEHDRPGDPLASIEASYRYLTGAGAETRETASFLRKLDFPPSSTAFDAAFAE